MTDRTVVPIVIFAIALGFTIAIGAIRLQHHSGQERGREAARASGKFFASKARLAPLGRICETFQRKAARQARDVSLQEAGMYTVSPAQMGVRVIACGRRSA